MSDQIGLGADLLNKELTRAEEALVALGLNANAEVPLHASRGLLGLGKCAGSWRLYVRKDEAGSARQLLLAMSLATRVEAAHALPGLHKALLANSGARVEKVLEATQAVVAFTAELEKHAQAQSLRGR